MVQIVVVHDHFLHEELFAVWMTQFLSCNLSNCSQDDREIVFLPPDKATLDNELPVRSSSSARSTGVYIEKRIYQLLPPPSIGPPLFFGKQAFAITSLERPYDHDYIFVQNVDSIDLGKSHLITLLRGSVLVTSNPVELSPLFPVKGRNMQSKLLFCIRE